MSTPESRGGGTKHRASPPLQKVGGHVPLSTHGSTPLARQFVTLKSTFVYNSTSVMHSITRLVRCSS